MKVFVCLLAIIVLLPVYALAQAVHTMRTPSYSHGEILYYENHNILKVSEMPLFNRDGEINEAVLENLLAIINNPMLDPMLREPKEYWPSGMRYEGARFTAVTAADFCEFVLHGLGLEQGITVENRNNSGAVVIRLFEAVPNAYGVENGHLSEFSSQWWQLVYRSTDDGLDVLTLWMLNPYRLTPFAGSRSDFARERPDERFSSWSTILGVHSNRWRDISVGRNTVLSDFEIYHGLAASPDFFMDGNYGAGIARVNLLRDFSFLLDEFGVGRFFVAPAELPGEWQSAEFQTGTNSQGRYYVSGEFKPTGGTDNVYFGSRNYRHGLGASGRWGSIDSVNINNGKDGQNVGPVSGVFRHTEIISTYYDLIWLPSEFEIRIMGHSKDTPNVQSFIEVLGDYYSEMVFNTAGNNAMTPSGRTGLWRMNGFGRGFNPYILGEELTFSTYTAWIRSAVSNGLGNANVVSAPGNRYGLGVHYLSGMRPAVHLSITDLLGEGDR